MTNTFLENNYEKKRLEFTYQKYVAYIDYIREGAHLILFHTYIPSELHQIENFGFTFLSEVKSFSIQNQLILHAKCPYAKALLKNIDEKMCCNE
ncbi:hypothetical protein [Flammeovirga sp. EKP202]|uniref:hypothetical protein n=1 Tax=Flammeovirga sp. EKP202 TaxID=2770592 RepID=UPI00165F3EBE|nr:hypothetical protein [Flammeovirga sp. EKP202]MBD0399936.1 hypothetical protein [Flammeovirga sp. EKP202]